jgi:hypothetical protein
MHILQKDDIEGGADYLANSINLESEFTFNFLITSDLYCLIVGKDN